MYIHTYIVLVAQIILSGSLTALCFDEVSWREYFNTAVCAFPPLEFVV